LQRSCFLDQKVHPPPVRHSLMAVPIVSSATPKLSLGEQRFLCRNSIECGGGTVMQSPRKDVPHLTGWRRGVELIPPTTFFWRLSWDFPRVFHWHWARQLG
jgi:hypothetical protein